MHSMRIFRFYLISIRDLRFVFFFVGSFGNVADFIVYVSHMCGVCNIRYIFIFYAYLALQTVY